VAVVRSGVLLLSAAGVVGGALTSPASAVVPNPPANGLPSFILGVAGKAFDPPLFLSKSPFYQQNQTGAADSALATGQSDARRAKVAIRLPTSLTAINLVANSTQTPKFNRKGRVVSGTNVLRTFQGFIYLKSPTGATPTFGLLPPVTINTLAFGILPAKVTVQLSQPRKDVSAQNPGGTPTPLTADVFEDVKRKIVYDTTVTGPIDLAVTELVIDGRRVDIGSSCRTATPSALSMVGKYVVGIPPAGFYNPTFGGDLYGTLTVPAFTGCRGAGGDDLSALFTNALSGSDTSIHLFQAPIGQGQVDCSLPQVTGSDIPCVQAKTLPQPTGTNQVPSVPQDWTPNLPPAPLPLLPTTATP